MLLTAAEVPVRLETLDQTGGRVFEIEAQLVHLDENYALISLDEPALSTRLHWGTPVRFELDDSMKRYEVTGAIVARHDDREREPSEEDAVEAIPMWELRVRIWDCKMNVQRRTIPRQRIGFPVHLREIAGGATSGAAPRNGLPVLARCVDIGAGGMRVRTAKQADLPARMHLEFSLPTTDDDRGAETSRQFYLTGRVIRALPQGRNGDNLDIAFCFEGLSVREGMALHNLLTYGA